jgi:hypothetical protein
LRGTLLFPYSSSYILMPTGLWPKPPALLANQHSELLLFPSSIDEWSKYQRTGIISIHGY